MITLLRKGHQAAKSKLQVHLQVAMIESIYLHVESPGVTVVTLAIRR
jgi:hypothetical protein